MTYLKDHLPPKEKPEFHFKALTSAIVIVKPYFPNENSLGSALRIAEYAKTRDYHFTFKEELERLKVALSETFPGEEFLCFTDSVPILERDLAVRAGLGWIGKNTCLIDRKEGSLFFIGEVLTSFEWEEEENRFLDFCGTCTRCIDICPTGALKENRVLDARACIAYLNIEAKTIPPLELREKMGDWFFGCDLCQTVCPWNEKSFGKELMRSLTQSSGSVVDQEMINELKFILNSSNKKLMDYFKESPLSRARGFGLKRNALVLIGNLKIKELKSDVIEASRLWPRLNELCKWTLECLNEIC